MEVINRDLRKNSKEEGFFIEWDVEIRKQWSHLINPPLTYKNKNNVARKECKLEPLLIGWKKLIFNRASRGNPRKVGIGCLIREETRNWLAKREKPLDITMNNMAELEAGEGLKISIYLSIKKTIIEGDSQIILNTLRRGKAPN